MTSTEFAIWSYCRAMAAARGGTVFFSGPKIAKKFRAMSKNTPYKAAKSLTALGWFKLIKRSEQKDGKYTATYYKVLSHEEYTREHPHSCPAPSQPEGTEPSHFEGTEPSQIGGTDASPSHSEGTTVPITGNDRPTNRELTNKNQLIKNTNTETGLLSPSQLEGTEFLGRFSKEGRKQLRRDRKAASAEAASALAQPSQNKGTANPPITAGELASEVPRILGIPKALAGSSWLPVMERLLAKGSEPADIIHGAEHYVREQGVEITQSENAKGFQTCYEYRFNPNALAVANENQSHTTGGAA